MNRENIVKVLKNKKVKMGLNVFIGLIFLFIVYSFYTTFSMDTDYKFESVVYDINDNYIENVSPYTSVDLYYKYFEMDDCSIKVYDSNNEEIVDGYVMSGSKTVLYDVNDDIIGNYINIIKGDYEADGEVDNSDLEKIGKCLVEECEFNDMDKKIIDIDSDGEVHINDLTMLDKTISGEYQSISLDKESMILQTGEKGRLVSKLEPSYGLNQNVKWISENTEIVTVDDAGRLVGGVEGETKVKAITMDDKLMAEATIKVDNTIQLLSYEGVAYVGGNDLKVGIKSIDYEGITCSVLNEDIASCSIDNDKLVISPLENSGDTSVKVTSPKYGEVIYKLTVQWVDFSIVTTKYGCVPPNSTLRFRVRNFFGGELSFNASDNEIFKDAYMKIDTSDGNVNKLWVEIGDKTGHLTIDVKEGNGNNVQTITLDVYRAITVTASDGQVGSVAKIGEEVYANINGEHTGVLSCESINPDKGTCRVEGNQLILTPLAVGPATFNIYNKFSYNGVDYTCGSTQFMILTQE